MPIGDMSTDDVRTMALEALRSAETRADPALKQAWTAIATGYARIYAADVERGR